MKKEKENSGRFVTVGTVAYEKKSSLDISEKQCNNILDFTVGDSVSFTGNGTVKKISDEDGNIVSFIEVDGVLLGASSKKKEKKENADMKKDMGSLGKAIMAAMKNKMGRVSK